MSFISGFIDQDSVFLFSDTAITEENSKNIISTSSFGELIYSEGETTIYQAEIKLFSLNNNTVILGCAGNSHSIDSFVENLTTYFSYGFSCETSLDNALVNIEYNDFEILIGYFENDLPLLLKKRINSLTIEKCSIGLTSIGVQKTHFNLFEKDFYELRSQTLCFNDWTPRKILVIINAILQAYGTWKYTLSEAVGGAFTSLYLDKQGANWQPSLAYVLFDVNHKALESISENQKNVLPNNLFSNSKYIFIDQREGSFYISSPSPNFTGFMFRHIDLKKMNFKEQWCEKYENELVDQFINLKFEYIVFICSNMRVVSIFEKTELDEKRINVQYGKKLKINFEICNEFDIQTYTEFINRISEPLDDELTIKV